MQKQIAPSDTEVTASKPMLSDQRRCAADRALPANGYPLA